MVTDITHVDDVASGICAVLDQAARSLGQTFNLSGGQALRLTEIINAACFANGITARWRPLPVGPAMAAVWMAELLARLPPRPPRATAYGLGILAYSQTLDLTRVQRDLGWQPLIAFDKGAKAHLFTDAGG